MTPQGETSFLFHDLRSVWRCCIGTKFFFRLRPKWRNFEIFLETWKVTVCYKSSRYTYRILRSWLAQETENAFCCKNYFFQLKYLISRHLIHSDLGENFIYWKHFPSYFSIILTNPNHIVRIRLFFFFFQTSKPERTAGEAGYRRNKVVSGYSWKLSNFGSLHEARFQSGFDDGVRFALESVEQLRLIARTLAASSRFYRTIFYRRGEKLGLTMDKRKKFRNNFTNFVRRRDFCRRGWGRGQVENQPAVVGNYFDERKKKKKNEVDAEERSWGIVLSGVSILKMPSCRRLYNMARCCVRFVPLLSSGLPRKI